MNCDPRLYKEWLDRELTFWAYMHPAALKNPYSPQFWLRHHLDVSGCPVLPLYRMRDLPPPFTISDEDRHGRG